MSAGQTPVCSVCIANFNGEHLLADCLDSVLQQDCDFPFEVIVHDDASTDASVALLRQRYPQVQLLSSPENLGFCGSNNRMVEQARGEYVLLLNNDAALHRNALSALYSKAANGPAILTLPQYDWASGTLVDLGCFLDLQYTPVPNLDPARSEVAMGIGACLWIPRGLWTRIGGLPEWMHSIAEDVYMCCAARLLGTGVYVVAGSGYRHRQGASFGGNRLMEGGLRTNYRRRRLSEANRLAVLVACTPGGWWIPFFLLHVFLLVLEGSILAVLRRDARIWREVYWGALLATFRRRTILAACRERLQTHRHVKARHYFSTFTWKPRKAMMLFRHGLPDVR